MITAWNPLPQGQIVIMNMSELMHVASIHMAHPQALAGVRSPLQEAV
jgi:hypothetical protein